MNILDEEWRDVLGFEGFYQVSDLGRVRSCDRVVPHSRTGFITLKGRVLKPAISRLYFGVNLCVNASGRSTPVHTLVARAFKGERPEGFDINHIDGDKLNNRADNLEYCSHLENITHAITAGLWDSRKGQKHGRAKLSDSDVSAIRQRIAFGESLTSIARYFGVSHGTISNIKTGKVWVHIK